MMTTILLMPLIPWAVAIAVTGWGTWIALKHFKDSSRGRRVLFPAVSVLKPLKGIEPGLQENLECFFRLDYPRYEIIFSLADEADPAVSLVRSLIAAYPHVDSRLVLGDTEAGPNPKVRNLLKPYAVSKYDSILISDSNVRVKADYLRKVVPHLGPNVGAVTAVVAGTAPAGVGGRLEAVYLNSFYARWMRIAEAFGFPCIVGKSMLFRRETIERFGGLRNLSRYIAEDYMAGKAILRLGLKVVIVPEPVQQHIGSYPFRSFWSRHIRWGRIRKSQAPIAFAAEPLFGALFSGVLGAIGFRELLDVSMLDFLTFHLGFWFLLDWLLMRKLQGGDFRRFFTIPLAWMLRELLAFPLWLHIASGNSISWRGKKLRILPGGLLVNT